jgi:hypothetical protein
VNRTITFEEIKHAIGKNGSNKAPGHDIGAPFYKENWESVR